MAETVECGRVNPVETVIYSSVNCRDRVVFVLRSHASVPTTSSNSPSTNSDGRNVEAAVSKLPFFHGESPWRAFGSAEYTKCEIACSPISETGCSLPASVRNWKQTEGELRVQL